MAVRHPNTWVCHVEQDVDGLASVYKDGVLPREVRLDHVVAGEDEEPTRAVDVERVVHRVVLVHVVHQADLHSVTDRERPLDLPVLLAAVQVDELPDHVSGI